MSSSKIIGSKWSFDPKLPPPDPDPSEPGPSPVPMRDPEEPGPNVIDPTPEPLPA
jgi:hypothetical protein